MRQFSYPNGEIEEVAQLENRLSGYLDYPDESHTSMEYTIQLGVHHSLNVQASSQSEGWLDFSAGYSHRIFLFEEQPLIQPTIDPADVPTVLPSCQRKVLFSLLHEHNDDEEDYVHGVSRGIPPEAMFAMPKDPAELATLALVGQLSARLSGQEDFWIARSEWGQHHLDVPSFIKQTGRLAAKGACIASVFISRETDDEVSLWAMRHAVSGEEQHISPAQRNQLRLTFSIVQNEIEYLYERMPRRNAEVKIRIDDELVRYADLPSLTVDYDEDGEPLCWSYDNREIEALEAEEREKGLYIPTKENMQLFLRHVEGLAPS